MKRRPFQLRLLAGLLLSILMVGCGSTEVAQPTPSVKKPEATSKKESPKATEKVADATKSPQESDRPQYNAPFPNRTDLFRPVQRKRVAKSSSRDSGESVVLKGFAHVDEPKAVLAIDGQVTSLGLGVERYGVQVISIEPPQVVLQRGRSRWTATLQ